MVESKYLSIWFLQILGLFLYIYLNVYSYLYVQVCKHPSFYSSSTDSILLHNVT